MKNEDISIVIADDHPITLGGLHEELIKHGFNVVGKASNGPEALALLIELEPMIALLDIDMPKLSGFDVLKMIQHKNLRTKGIVLSFHKESEYIVQAESLNIQGYLLKEDTIDVIDSCIKSVLNNNRFFSPSFQKSSLLQASQKLHQIEMLTPSEKTILKYVAEQLSTAQIAEKLFVSHRTVEKHRSNIIQKLQIDTQTNALLQWALLNKDLIISL